MKASRRVASTNRPSPLPCILRPSVLRSSSPPFPTIHLPSLDCPCSPYLRVHVHRYLRVHARSRLARRSAEQSSMMSRWSADPLHSFTHSLAHSLAGRGRACAVPGALLLPFCVHWPAYPHSPTTVQSTMAPVIDSHAAHAANCRHGIASDPPPADQQCVLLGFFTHSRVPHHSPAFLSACCKYSSRAIPGPSTASMIPCPILPALSRSLARSLVYTAPQSDRASPLLYGPATAASQHFSSLPPSPPSALRLLLVFWFSRNPHTAASSSSAPPF